MYNQLGPKRKILQLWGGVFLLKFYCCYHICVFQHMKIKSGYKTSIWDAIYVFLTIHFSAIVSHAE